MSSVPPPLPPSERKPRSGCLTALYIMLGLGAFILVVGAIGIWLFLRSETGRQFTETVSSGIALTTEATRAPGTQELRAAGCSQAMVIPAARMFELLGAAAPEVRAESGAFGEQTVVMCQLSTADDSAPDCADVARIYAAAVPDGPERFGVIVQAQRGGALCDGAYGRDGSRLETEP